MNLLFIGDIFGKPGRTIVIDQLPVLREQYSIDLCIANGENLTHGRGITEKTAVPLFEAGIDLFTSGNHLWDQKNAFSYLETEPRILKPANYPAAAIGNEFYLHSFSDQSKVAVVSLIGQAFMGPANSPFETIDRLLPLLHQETRVVIVDFHAEATAEKRALGFYLDGRVSCLIGTHTHVQTADEEILPGGTAYLTDVGMTGPHDSVIGIEKEIILKKLVSGMPYRYEVASGGLEINALLIEIEQKSGKALKIERIKRKIS